MSDIKACSRCKKDKPLSRFCKDKNRPDGLHPQCRECTREVRQLKPCSICSRVPQRLKRGLCNTCYERLRKHGLLNGIADDPIPNGAWLLGRGHRSQLLPTTPAPPKSPHPGLASSGQELPDFVPVIRTIHPIGTRTVWANGYVGLKTVDGVKKEHSVVMEEHLGRSLIGGESVHHKNGDRTDNRIGNLELWYRGQPAGQRVTDLISYLVEYHRDDIIDALNSKTTPSLARIGQFQA